MFKQVDQLNAVKGVTGYKCKDGVPEQFPFVVDTGELNLPQITHPTQTVQMMGDSDMPDQTRVNSMTTGIGCELSILHSKVMGYGVQEYLFKWAQEIKKEDGSFGIVGFSAYIAGIPAEDVSATVRVGDTVIGTVNVATLKYRLVVDGEEIRFVDKRTGVLRINGVDYRAEINKLL